MGTPQVTLCALGGTGSVCAYEHVAARVPRGREGDRSNRLCPCHDDTKASLSINPGTEGMRTVWHCGAGCDPAAIRAELLDLGVDPTCLGNYADPERRKRRMGDVRRIEHDPVMAADAKRYHAILKVREVVDGKLLGMCIQAISEGDGDLPADPSLLLPCDRQSFIGLATRAGIEHSYRYKLYQQWLRSEAA